MKRETLVIRPEKVKRRIGVMPTIAQRDRTKYTRKAKHRQASGNSHQQNHSARDGQPSFPEWFLTPD